jgi:redox-sensitive bicupin YhaK (pirin superfamily)
MLWQENIPVLHEKDNAGKSIEVTVIAGSLKGFQAPTPTPDSWAADPGNEVMILTIKLESLAKWVLPKASSGVNRSLYFYKGNELQIDDEKIPAKYSVRLKADQDTTLEAGAEDCYLLLLQGKPINEPVVQYGPFVMNTEEEIQEAYHEYQRTQFGGWPWPQHEQIHPRDKGRFALHADGRVEKG